ADRAPDQERVRGRQVYEVVVHRRPGGRSLLDADVAVSARAADAVVDADVVRDGRARGAAFDVDAGGHVAVHGIPDDHLSGRREVVDPVVAVVVRDVVVDERVVRAGVALDPR